jgi:hypothetical protein
VKRFSSFAVRRSRVFADGGRRFLEKNIFYQSEDTAANFNLRRAFESFSKTRRRESIRSTRFADESKNARAKMRRRRSVKSKNSSAQKSKPDIFRRR